MGQPNLGDFLKEKEIEHLFRLASRKWRLSRVLVRCFRMHLSRWLGVLGGSDAAQQSYGPGFFGPVPKASLWLFVWFR